MMSTQEYDIICRTQTKLSLSLTKDGPFFTQTYRKGQGYKVGEVICIGDQPYFVIGTEVIRPKD
jgi:hypothetical protein